MPVCVPTYKPNGILRHLTELSTETGLALQSLCGIDPAKHEVQQIVIISPEDLGRLMQQEHVCSTCVTVFQNQLKQETPVNFYLVIARHSIKDSVHFYTVRANSGPDAISKVEVECKAKRLKVLSIKTVELDPSAGDITDLGNLLD
jgi:hypothetical protein